MPGRVPSLLSIDDMERTENDLRKVYHKMQKVYRNQHFQMDRESVHQECTNPNSSSASVNRKEGQDLCPQQDRGLNRHLSGLNLYAHQFLQGQEFWPKCVNIK